MMIDDDDADDVHTYPLHTDATLKLECFKGNDLLTYPEQWNVIVFCKLNKVCHTL